MSTLMRTRKKRIRSRCGRTAQLGAIALFGLCILASRQANAGGFYVPEIGARAMSMAGAVVSTATDPSSIFHNPAGLAYVGGTHVQLNAMGAMANINYWRRPIKNSDGRLTMFDKVSNTNRFGVVPSLFVGSNFGLKKWGFGVGVYVPFGAQIEYPEDGAQRYSIVEANLRNFFVTPTISYRLSSGWSFGAGFNYVFSTIELRQASSSVFVIGAPEDNLNPDSKYDGFNTLKGKDTASFGANFGLRYQHPDGRYGFGVSLMLPTSADFRGDAEVRNETIGGGETFEEFGELEKGKRDEKFHMRFRYPMVLRLGMNLRPFEAVSVNLDLNWQRWSTSKELVIDFEKNQPLLLLPGAILYDVVIPQHWKDTLSARLGIEYTPAKSLPLRLRAGVLLDQSPVEDRYFDMMTPDSDKLGLSGGVGYTLSLGKRVKLQFDLAFLHLRMKERNIRPIAVGPQTKTGNDDNDPEFDDSVKNEDFTLIPGSAKTILNKPAPSFHYGVTRAFANLLGLTVAVRL